MKHWFKNRRAKFRRTDGWEARSQMNDEETAPEYVLSVLRNHYPEARISKIAIRAPSALDLSLLSEKLWTLKTILEIHKSNF